MKIAVYLLISLLALLSWKVTAISEGLACVVLTDPTIYGQNLEIGCISKIMSSCMLFEYNRAWLVDNKHIFLNGSSFEGNRKYKEDVRSCNMTVLIISNFSESDVDKIIRCSVREHDCRIRTTPQAIHLEYPTSHIRLIKRINFTASLVEMICSFAMVYPEPNCSFFYQGNDITNQSKVDIVNRGHFFTKEYHLSYKPEEAQCPSSIRGVCQIGRKTIKVVEEVFRNCTHPALVTPEYLIGWLLFLTVVSVIVIGLVAQSIIRNRHNITQLLHDVGKRTWIELRRPVIGLVLFIISTCSVLTTIVTLVVDFHSLEITEHIGAFISTKS